jgi:hypothetical protein
LWHVDPLLGNDGEITNRTTAVARQWLSSDYVGTPTYTNATTAQQQRNGAFCAVCAGELVGELASELEGCCSTVVVSRCW